MTFLKTAAHHPRKIWLRKAVFQVHLWIGVLLTLYLVVIALTGSVLVFENELTGITLPSSISRALSPHPIGIPEIVARVDEAYPGTSVDFVTTPTQTVPAYTMQVKLHDGRAITLVGGPASGALYEQGPTWVQWIHDLHVYLLLDRRYGMQVNGIGGAVLLLLAITGLVLWWPGLRIWTRGLRVNLRANWRRVNYDFHNAIGFWTLLIVFWWALSGVYFGFYQPFTKSINTVFPIRNMKAPPNGIIASPGHRVSLEKVILAAYTASPHGTLASLSNAGMHDEVSYASIDLAEPGDFLHRDIVRIDATSGRVLSVWHYSEKHSVGDWILWLMHPLHFGTLWGLGIKIVWAALGVSLALLAISGLLMYWNRVLRKLF